MTAIVGVTAQNTEAILAVHRLPTAVITAQLDAVYSDIGVDVAKTGALLSADIVATVAAFLEEHPTPLVIDPVLGASTGASLLEPDGVEVLIARLLPLATVVTPNLAEARVLAGSDGDRRTLAKAIAGRGAHAVLITGGDAEPVSTSSSTESTSSRSRSPGSTAQPRTERGARIRQHLRQSSRGARRFPKPLVARPQSLRRRFSVGSRGSVPAPGPWLSVRPRARASGCARGRRAGRSRSCRSGGAVGRR